MRKDGARTRGLWYVARNLAGNPEFMAHELARIHAAGIDPADTLGIDDTRLARLALCKRPRHDGRFVADVIAIAEHIGVDPDRLTRVLKANV